MNRLYDSELARLGEEASDGQLHRQLVQISVQDRTNAAWLRIMVILMTSRCHSERIEGDYARRSLEVDKPAESCG